MTKSRDIPRFFLFGEPLRTVEGRFFHVEDLDDRSRPNAWNIRVHAHADLNHLFHVATGGGVMSAEERALEFTAPCLLLVPSGVVHGFVWEAETTGSVLTIADSYLRELAGREPDFENLFREPRHLQLGTTSGVAAAISALSRELVWAAPGGGAAAEAQLLAILVEALRQAVADQGLSPLSHGAQAGLVARFRENIEATYRQGLRVDDHAAALGVSRAQLGAACRKVAGAPPLRLVHDRIALEAKRALLYSNMTVAEIAYHLGFNEAAYFSRFFTKAVGCGPRWFRANRGALGRERPA